MKTHFQMFILGSKEPWRFADYEKVWHFLEILFYLKLLDKNCFLKELSVTSQILKCQYLQIPLFKISEILSKFYNNILQKIHKNIFNKNHDVIRNLQNHIFRFFDDVITFFKKFIYYIRSNPTKFYVFNTVLWWFICILFFVTSQIILENLVFVE